MLNSINEKALQSDAAGSNQVRGAYNEHMFVYHLNGMKWTDPDHKNQAMKLKKSLDAVGPQEARIQDDRAKEQASAFLDHAKSLGYSGVDEIHNTAKAGGIEAATGIKLSQQENPSDVIVKFKKKPAKAKHGFFGASLKSSTAAKIGFHNGGAGTMDKELGTNIEGIGKERHETFREKNKLSTAVGERAKQIKGEGDQKRNNPLYDAASEAANNTHEDIRNHLHDHYSGMQQKDLKSHLLNTFLKADSNKENIPYVKAHGRGGGDKDASAHIEAPHDNPVYHAIKNSNNITMEKSGKSYIRVMADGKKAFSIQVKHNNEPMASSIKILGQP